MVPPQFVVVDEQLRMARPANAVPCSDHAGVIKQRGGAAIVHRSELATVEEIVSSPTKIKGGDKRKEGVWWHMMTFIVPARPQSLT